MLDVSTFVYCEKCKHFISRPLVECGKAIISSSKPSPIKLEHTFSYTNPLEKNKNNNCEDYKERKWWKIYF